MSKSNVGKIIMLCLIVSTLVACNRSSTEEKIYDHLENAVEKEKGFEEQQDPIVKLERKEQKIYDKVIDLDTKDEDKIQDLAKQARQTIKKRSAKIAKEKESMDASKKEFTQVKKLEDKLDDNKIKKAAKTMGQTMDKRYSAYETLHKSYKNALEQETKLYEMLPDKDVKQEKIFKQISKVNDAYQAVLDTNKKFNTYTEKYNDNKKAFYNVADMDVDVK